MKILTTIFCAIICWAVQVHAGISFDGECKENDRIIAEQCASCGGDAIFRARALYALYDPIYRFADTPECVTTRSASMPSKPEKVAGFAVYPNPAVDKVTIELGKQFSQSESDHTLMLYSMTGVVLQKVMLPSKAVRYVLDTSSLPGGSYYLILYEGMTPVHAEQLVIVK